ncbi:aminopeptidase N-like [Ptychodera flava]|uniref:aminopeptidase N-like n=1 Tax=Ptychodera flava TaxID=63121 RepID=UPI003969C724
MYRYGEDYADRYSNVNPVMASFSDLTEDIVPSRPPQKPAHTKVIEDRSERGRPSSGTPSVSSTTYRSERMPFVEPKGFFISYWRLFWLVLLVVLLVLIVAILTAFIDSPRRGSGEVSGTAPPTTLDPSIPYHRPRLPTNVVPKMYDIDLTIDADDREYSGSVGVTVSCSENTKYIILHSAFLTIDPDKVSVSRDGYAEPLDVRRQFYFELHQYYVIEMENELEVDEEYRIAIGEFKGVMYQDLTGLYISEYTDVNANLRKVIATQFSPTFARKAFPCFDEPGMKAIFQVTVDHPRDYKVLCNTKVALDRPSAVSDTWQVDVCEATPVMPTYVVGLVLVNPDYRSMERIRPDGFQIRVWSRSEVINHLDWLLDIADRSLLFFESYFTRNEVIRKSDHVAIPTHMFNAMENWGLVTYYESNAVYNQVTETIRAKVWTAIISVHECAHMWFGNLVTMKWWADVWLKEGFATFFMYEAMEVLEPSWGMSDIAAVEIVQDALIRDGFVTSKQMSDPAIDEVDEIFANFGWTVYYKGLSILRMLKGMLGTEAFDRGIHTYIDRYKFSNADTGDLWNEFTKATGGSLDVKHIMDTWIFQKGYPVVTVRRTTDQTTGQKRVVIEQSYYVLKSESTTINYGESRYGYKWDIPFTYVTSSDRHNVVTKWLYANTTSETFDLPGDHSNNWILGNIGLTGFYRVNYDIDNWNRIIRQLADDHTVFTPVSRAAIIDDAFALQRAGLLDTQTAMRVTLYLTKEDQYEPWLAAIRRLNYLYDRLCFSPIYGMYEIYVRGLLRDVEGAQGWTVNTDQENIRAQSLREVILQAACKYGSDACVSTARSLFQSFIESGEPVEPGLTRVVNTVGIMYGNEDDWNKLWSIALAGNHVINAEALAASSIPWILERYMSRCVNLSSDCPVTRHQVVGQVGNNVIGHTVAMDFIDDHWNDILATFYSARVFEDGILTAADLSNTESGLRVLESLLGRTSESHPAYSVLEKVIEKVKINVEWTHAYEYEMRRFLESDEAKSVL